VPAKAMTSNLNAFKLAMQAYWPALVIAALQSLVVAIALQTALHLPFGKLMFALRLIEGARVILLQPGERRALFKLPLVSVTGTALARVLEGEAPHVFARIKEESRLIVPLRVQGKVGGALIFSAETPNELAESHVDSAQRLADIVAAHLELLRRTAVPPSPVPTQQPTARPPAVRAHPATPPLRTEPR